MKKKYKLLKSDFKIVEGVKLFRIEAIINFGAIVKGDLGGYIENERNLSQIDEAWVFGKACVFDEARVFGEARVFDEARVFGEARVFDEARVSGKACVFGEAQVYGESRVSDEACVFGEAQVYGKARVFGESRVSVNLKIFTGLEFVINTSGQNKEGLLLLRVGCLLRTHTEWETELRLNTHESKCRDDRSYKQMKNAILFMIKQEETK